MNIPPVNARSDALPTLRGEKLTAEMLSVKIDQLLNLLERKDISPQQRETLIRTLTALQQERTLLSQLASGAKNTPPATQVQNARPDVATAARATTVMQSNQPVVIGDTAKALMSKSEIQHAIQANQVLDKALGNLAPASQTSDVVRSPLENYLAVAAQNPVVNVKPDESDNKITSVIDPKPLFGIIPQDWLPTGMRTPARSSGWIMFVGILVLLGVMVWIW